MIFSTFMLITASCIFSISAMQDYTYPATQKMALPEKHISPILENPLSKGIGSQDTLIRYIRDNQIDQFKEYLIHNKLTHDYEPKQSPLYYAIKLNRQEFIRVLLTNGARIRSDELKIIIDNPTQSNYEILQLIAPHLNLQKLDPREVQNLFVDPYRFLDEMYALLHPEAENMYTPRPAQNENEPSKRHLFCLAALVGFISYYIYLSHEDARHSK